MAYQCLRPDSYRGQIQKFKLDGAVVAAAGDNIILAAPGAGLRYRLLKLAFSTRNAVNVVLKAGAGTAISGAYEFIAPGGYLVEDFDETPLDVESAPGVGNLPFIINLSGAVGIDGQIQYVLDNS